MVAGSDGPQGELVADAEVHGVVDIEGAPALVGGIGGVVVDIVGGSVGIGEAAEGVDAVVQLLVGIAEVEAEHGRSTRGGVGQAHMLGEDVAVVVGIGDGVLRLATVVAGGMAEGEGVIEHEGTAADGEGQGTAMAVLEEGHLVGLVGIALVAEHLDDAHHGTVVDERLVELVALAVGGKLKALGATVVGVVEA